MMIMLLQLAKYLEKLNENDWKVNVMHSRESGVKVFYKVLEGL